MTRLRDTPHGKLLPRDAAKLTGRLDGPQVAPREYLDSVGVSTQGWPISAPALRGFASRPCPSPAASPLNVEVGRRSACASRATTLRAKGLQRNNTLL